MLIFFLSVLDLYNDNINNTFLKKEFPFLISGPNDVNIYSNLSKQIYKYFSVFKNNAISGLLFREKNQNKLLEFKKNSEKLLTFNPVLDKNSKKFISNTCSMDKMKLSVEKNYQQYQKNKELKLKEKEMLLENAEKEKCTFVPSGYNSKRNHNVSEITQRLFTTGLKHLKLNNSTINNYSLRDKTYNSLTENIHKDKNDFKKMFNNNPLESDLNVKKKLLKLEETRNKKAYEKLILKKGFIRKEDMDENKLYIETEYKNDRFAHDDEVSNTYKNTFDRYGKIDKKQSNKNKKKCEFEISVDRKPSK